MIIIITALYAEAKPYIEYYHAGKNPKETVYQEFVSEEARILISGCGAVAAAATLARYFTKYPPQSSDLLVNIGIAGAAASDPSVVGRLYLAVKLTETATARTFFPDLLFRHDFLKAELYTFPKPVSYFSGEPEAGWDDHPSLPVLVDMEGAAIYQAALSYLTPERMFFLKTVSDLVGGAEAAGGTDAADMSDEAGVSGMPDVSGVSDLHPDPYRLLKPQTEAVAAWLSQIAEALQAEAFDEEKEESSPAVSELFERLSFTEAMRLEAERLFRYCRLSGIPVTEPLERFLSRIPETVCGKKNSMPYFQLLREMLLGDEEACVCGDTQAAGHEVSKDDNPAACMGQSRYLPAFSTIYVEEQLSREKLFSDFSDCFRGQALDSLIAIRHYKDVFNRSRQNFARQKKAPALILAKNEGTLLYPGAPVCQSFGNEHFYYTSNIFNCIYHCDYCYLQGMYPSGHLVVFVNQEDTFAKLELLLNEHPVYLCVSYDTDLLALEAKLHFAERWIAYAAGHPGLTLEIRTKSGNPGLVRKLADGHSDGTRKRVIFAWTLSPAAYASRYEHGTAPLSMRLRAAEAAADAGFGVRFCFDPMIFTPSWKADYRKLVSDVFLEFPAERLQDVSVGTFRIGSGYLKQMRKNRPDNALVWFPYLSENGVSHYGALSGQMTDFMREELRRYLPEEKLFFWESENK